MTWVAVAIVGGSVIGAIGSNMAADTQAQGQQQAANTQAGMFNTINQQEQPFIQAGYGATSDLRALMGQGGPGNAAGGLLTGAQGATPGSNSTGLPNGYLTKTFDPNSLDSNPAYQFALKTGGQAVRNADTPGVGALSGAALKDLTAFNVGTANQYENQYFNQFQTQQNNIFNRLSAIAGLGQNAATQTGNAGAQLGTGIAQAQAGAAASQAGGIVGSTNALAGGANSLAGLMYLNAGQAGGGGGGGGGGGVGIDPWGYLGGATAGDYSDVRLKTNLKRIGTSERGSPVYTWDWKTGGKGVGVIAQEVMHIPGAVTADLSGLLKVNYDLV